MDLLFENWIWFVGAVFVVFATFGPDRRPVKPQAKLDLNSIIDLYKLNPLNWVPATLAISVAALVISMGMIFAEGGETMIGYPLVSIGLLFGVSEVINRLKNFKNSGWRTFTGFLIPAIILLYIGFVMTHDPLLAPQPNGYYFGIGGIIFAALDIVKKLKYAKQP